VSVYDAGGLRLATQVGGALTNVCVYDAMGKLLAEYGPAAAGPGGTNYLMSDHQGSPRVVTTTNGSVASRHDYLPFGEELNAGVGLRNSNQGYGGVDAARQKYAGMESDDGSGMATTLWRKYDSSSGRWTSPDPYGGSMSVGDPQSFNRYSYVNNDPVNMSDPSGLEPYRGADAGWAEFAKEVEGETINPLRTHFGGPEALGGALMDYAKRVESPLRSVRGGAPWYVSGSDDPEIIRTYTVAFHSREEAIAYYEREFGGSVFQLGRMFYSARSISAGVSGAMIPLGFPHYPGPTSYPHWLPRKVGNSLGFLGAIVLGRQGYAGTGGVFAMRDLGSNTTTLGETHGAFAFDRPQTAGYIANLGIGEGVIFSNARDGETDGDSQAVIVSIGPFGGEGDFSRNQNGEVVYTININVGKSLGAGAFTMPVRTNTTGPIEPWLMKKFGRQ
jgi:RHS repeat-associated protein